MINLEDTESIKLDIKDEGYSYNGRIIPRVTNIISKTISEDYLMKWSNSLGFKRKSYKQTLSESAMYGSKVHNGIECYLKGLPVPENVPSNPFNVFLQWWSIVNDGNEVEILGQEVKMTCPWFGGTYDLLIKINGKIYLVDFKTSNHLSYKYCLQLSAYRYMLKYNNLYDGISGIVILQLNKDYPDFNEYVLHFNNKIHSDFFDLCEKTFLSMVYTYYHILETERQYKLGV